MRTLLLLSLLSVPAYMAPAHVAAQDVELTEPVLLREGRPAPFTGQLMAQADVLAWAAQIESLRAALARDATWATERCDVLLTVERARTTAATDVGALRDGLYQARIAELAAAVVEARQSAVRGWWESDVMWAAIGAILGVAVVVAAVAAR